MSKTMSVVGILALAAFLACVGTADARDDIIVRTLLDMGVARGEVAVYYQAVVQTMSTNSHLYVRSAAKGLADLEGVYGGPAARQQALRLAVDSCVQLRVAVAHRIILIKNSLAGMADPRPLLQALRDPAMWRQSVFTPLYNHVCNVAATMGIGGGATGAAATRLAGGSAAGAARGAALTKGGFVSLPILLSTVTAVVAGTGGYIKGKAMVERQHLKVQAAETETYVNTLRVLIRSMRAGRAKLPKGLTLEKAADRIVRNIDAGLPPFANVLELKPAPDISGAWTGDLVIKEVRGASRLRVGRSRPLKGRAFVIEQDHNELVLTFRRQRVKGYFQPQLVQMLGTHVGSKRTLTVVDIAVLDEPLPGSNLRRAELKYHSGAGAGSMAGQLVVEIVQTLPGSGTLIVSGGMLTRMR